MLRLYTDESPGLKVDPMVILFLSLGFIFSVVALHRMFNHHGPLDKVSMLTLFLFPSHRKGHQEILVGASGRSIF